MPTRSIGQDSRLSAGDSYVCPEIRHVFERFELSIGRPDRLISMSIRNQGCRDVFLDAAKRVIPIRVLSDKFEWPVMHKYAAQCNQLERILV